ncbi:major facilitator superfamily protein [Hirsutella rhossiliensis]|uniref:Major facilitator superfamily domain-containing protein n=1 Tax=Hirsutella rhossiliensis TaxID=111463 RepID=A0A9P8MX71_9HYPO|nr:major facilitator superfamily domain-containing protein [Hirsutella rhossiliensis]KAH0962905.1 major facilitator superfamily domain-containing protein [Hirsutella rhossiliensis]
MDKEKDAHAGPGPLVVGDNASSASDDGHSGSEKTKVHQFNEQTNYVPKRTIITIFLACASVDLLALMDQTTLAASLYIIGNSLGSSDQVSWIASGYFITSTVGQLLYGRLSDIWSRKLILLVGLAIFFFGSLASSLSQSVLQLTVFRAFTGIGGGGLMTVAQLIVSDVVPLRERGKYQGILGAVVAIANGIGPVIGGALSSQSAESWRWIFRLNLPLTVLTTGCAVFFMPLKKVQGDWKMKLKAVDFVGIFLAFAGMTVVILGLTWGGREYDWNSAHVIATLVVGSVVSVAFVVWQWKGPKYPLVPLHIFKSKIVNGACLTMAINGWNFVMQVYYVPTFYQLVYGYSATKSGALLLPITIVQTVSSTLSGLIVHWVGRYRECILFGWVCWAVGLGLMSTLDESTGIDKQIGYSILIGIGVGNTLQPALIATQAGVERRDMAVVTSFRNFVRNLGSTLGLAVSGAILNNILASDLSSLALDQASTKTLLGDPQRFLTTVSPEEAERIRSILIPAYRQGFRVIFLVGASLAVLAFFLALLLMPQVELTRPDDAKLKEEGRRAQEEQKKKSSA